MARAKVPSRAESRVEKGEQMGESTHPPLRTLEFLAQQSFNIKGRVIIASRSLNVLKTFNNG